MKAATSLTALWEDTDGFSFADAACLSARGCASKMGSRKVVYMKCAVCTSEAETELGLCSPHDQQFRAEAAEAAERLKASPDDPEAEKLAASIANNHVRLVAREMTGHDVFRGLDITRPGWSRELRQQHETTAPKGHQPAPAIGVLGIQEEK